MAGNYILKNLKDKKLAILSDKTAYGEGISNEVKRTVNAGGMTEVMDEGVTVGDKDFSAIISKMKAAGVETIYFGGLYTEGGLIVRQAADQGLHAVLIGGDGITSSEFGQIAGQAAAGTLMTFAPDPRLNPAAKAIVASFRSDGFEPEAYTLYSFAALEVLKAGFAQSNSLDPQKVADALKHMSAPIPTVIGKLEFDEKGDRKDEDYTMYVWKADASGAMTYSMLP